MPKPVDKGTTYVPGLDGLRTLAVAVVILYHLNISGAPGGLLGVGVFFTLSGYLITSNLMRSWDRRRNLGLKTFWLRRFRRLAPAMIVTVIATLILTVALDRSALTVRAGEALSTFFYVNNWHTIVKGSSYFDNFAGVGPFDHMWSLSVEEQFYLIWPLVLLALLVLLRGRRTLVAWATVVITVASFALMWVLADGSGDNTRVYEGTDTRAGGLLLGAALAVWLSARRTSGKSILPNQAASAVLGFIGVGGIVAMVVLVDRDDVFLYHGGIALLTVAAACAILSVLRPDGLWSRILGWLPMRWLGERSYGIYLWHMPVIAFLPAGWLEGKLLLSAALTVGIAVGLSAVSWKYFEDPIRRHGVVGPVKAWWAARGGEQNAPVDAAGVVADAATEVPAAASETDAVAVEAAAAETAEAETVVAETPAAETAEAETAPAETAEAETVVAATAPAPIVLAAAPAPGAPGAPSVVFVPVIPTSADAGPAEVEPAEVEPAEVEQADVEPAEVEQADVEPADVEPAEVERAEVERAEVEPEAPVPTLIEEKPTSPVKAAPVTIPASTPTEIRHEGRLQSYIGAGAAVVLSAVIVIGAPSVLANPNGDGTSAEAGAVESLELDNNGPVTADSSTAVVDGVTQMACTKVIHVGDSTSLGIFNPEMLPDPSDIGENQYLAHGAPEVETSVFGGRNTTEGFEDYPSAVDSVAELLTYDQPEGTCWVIGTGVNDAANIAAGATYDEETRIRMMLDQLKGERVMWSTAWIRNDSGYYTNANNAKFNEVLKRVTKDYPNAVVWDWAAEVQNHMDWFMEGEDNVHYSAEGNAARGRLFAAALANAFPKGGPDPVPGGTIVSSGES
ncbi:acyltransferase family protein [Corynebacterium terpenotabidum]|uniref:Acyltransferase 3 domain-containing protein n=1 Tax=Corynebacterium terpenotabidum Y-11 TaxID=1200352 RepID=S4XF92_9CORY|nr:acyltransferase family protein [Corynebacterium terpenotabidum]AGP31802.1 hypothetical protein A606_10815 [Corynebacterium terpenotabidum Y-11]